MILHNIGFGNDMTPNAQATKAKLDVKRKWYIYENMIHIMHL